MPPGPRIAIIYYSATGTVHLMAVALAAAAEAAGAEVRLRRVHELAPQETVASLPAWAAHAAATADVTVALPGDVVWADAVIFGSPVRFGNVAAQLKQFVDTLGGLWLRGELADKAYSGFCAGSTPHGGLETTLLAMYNMIYHFGGVVVPPGYAEQAKLVDGNPYGTSHVKVRGSVALGPVTEDAAAAQARRVVAVAAALRVVTLATAA